MDELSTRFASDHCRNISQDGEMKGQVVVLTATCTIVAAASDTCRSTQKVVQLIFVPTALMGSKWHVLGSDIIPCISTAHNSKPWSVNM